jgi:hypothetical protein
LDWTSLDRKAYGHSSGVVWSDAMQTDALLVNLHKSEKDFSPSTMYRDYAISSNLFHWESQNTTTTASPTERRYLSHRESGSHVVLFVRNAPTNDLGAAPFLCLGQAHYVEHRGERPIAITWRLHRPMPADTFAAACSGPMKIGRLSISTRRRPKRADSPGTRMYQAAGHTIFSDSKQSPCSGFT